MPRPGTGLTGAERLQVLLQVDIYVRGDAAHNAALAAARGDLDAAGSMATAWARLVAEVSDAERYPAVRELIDSDAFVEDHDPTEQFELGLGRMLDGLASLVGARAGSAAK